ncbi:MAG: hypothetical protein A3J69_00375 [Candidatus Levybacteria bacterium RIFCSPHIGHO2_02_FULL_42_12]|nr:MAG: hypothetical protein A3J69_00375 [Candidatus Levybacteria bacterium RIFCSPHIGHO2_02_FULL_42_12]
MAQKKIDYVAFFKEVGKSKRLLRTGWVNEKVKDPESVAEHSFRVGVMAMVLSDNLGIPLNKEKLIKMALLHDLGEVITGDIVTQRGEIIDIKKRDEKEKKEHEGVQKIFSTIDGADEYDELYHEMIGRTTPEAKIFWQFDKLEMIFQALEYEEEQGKDLEEFFEGVRIHYMRDPFLSKIFEEIVKQRPKKIKKH